MPTFPPSRDPVTPIVDLFADSCRATISYNSETIRGCVSPRRFQSDEAMHGLRGEADRRLKYLQCFSCRKLSVHRVHPLGTMLP